MSARVLSLAEERSKREAAETTELTVKLEASVMINRARDVFAAQPALERAVEALRAIEAKGDPEQIARARVVVREATRKLARALGVKP